MEKTYKPIELFVVSHSGNDLLVRQMTMDELDASIDSLRDQYARTLEDMAGVINQQLTLNKYLGALEFERERKQKAERH